MHALHAKNGLNASAHNYIHEASWNDYHFHYLMTVYKRAHPFIRKRRRTEVFLANIRSRHYS